MSWSIFKDVKFFVIRSAQQDVIDELKASGALQHPLLSESVRFAISDDPSLEEVGESEDLYAVSVVTLSVDDRLRIWAYATVHGAEVRHFLDRSVTHLIVGRAAGLFYKACKEALTDCSITLVTPDWVGDCLAKNELLPSDPYHPDLLKRPVSSRREPLAQSPASQILRTTDTIGPPQSDAVSLDNSNHSIITNTTSTMGMDKDSMRPNVTTYTSAGTIQTQPNPTATPLAPKSVAGPPGNQPHPSIHSQVVTTLPGTNLQAATGISVQQICMKAAAEQQHLYADRPGGRGGRVSGTAGGRGGAAAARRGAVPPVAPIDLQREQRFAGPQKFIPGQPAPMGQPRYVTTPPVCSPQPGQRFPVPRPQTPLVQRFPGNIPGVLDRNMGATVGLIAVPGTAALSAPDGSMQMLPQAPMQHTGQVCAQSHPIQSGGMMLSVGAPTTIGQHNPAGALHPHQHYRHAVPTVSATPVVTTNVINSAALLTTTTTAAAATAPGNAPHHGRGGKSKSSKHAQEQNLNEEEKDAIVIQYVRNIMNSQNKCSRDSGPGRTCSSAGGPESVMTAGYSVAGTPGPGMCTGPLGTGLPSTGMAVTAGGGGGFVGSHSAPGTPRKPKSPKSPGRATTSSMSAGSSLGIPGQPRPPPKSPKGTGKMGTMTKVPSSPHQLQQLQQNQQHQQQTQMSQPTSIVMAGCPGTAMSSVLLTSSLPQMQPRHMTNPPVCGVPTNATQSRVATGVQQFLATNGNLPPPQAQTPVPSGQPPVMSASPAYIVRHPGGQLLASVPRQPNGAPTNTQMVTAPGGPYQRQGVVCAAVSNTTQVVVQSPTQSTQQPQSALVQRSFSQPQLQTQQQHHQQQPTLYVRTARQAYQGEVGELLSENAFPVSEHSGEMGPVLVATGPGQQQLIPAQQQSLYQHQQQQVLQQQQQQVLIHPSPGGGHQLMQMKPPHIPQSQPQFSDTPNNIGPTPTTSGLVSQAPTMVAYPNRMQGQQNNTATAQAQSPMIAAGRPVPGQVTNAMLAAANNNNQPQANVPAIAQRAPQHAQAYIQHTQQAQKVQFSLPAGQYQTMQGYTHAQPTPQQQQSQPQQQQHQQIIFQSPSGQQLVAHQQPTVSMPSRGTLPSATMSPAGVLLRSVSGPASTATVCHVTHPNQSPHLLTVASGHVGPSSTGGMNAMTHVTGPGNTITSQGAVMFQQSHPVGQATGHGIMQQQHASMGHMHAYPQQHPSGAPIPAGQLPKTNQLVMQPQTMIRAAPPPPGQPGMPPGSVPNCAVNPSPYHGHAQPQQQQHHTNIPVGGTNQNHAGLLRGPPMMNNHHQQQHHHPSAAPPSTLPGSMTPHGHHQHVHPQHGRPPHPATGAHIAQRPLLSGSNPQNVASAAAGPVMSGGQVGAVGMGAPVQATAPILPVPPTYYGHEGAPKPSRPEECLISCVLLLLGYRAAGETQRALWRRIMRSYGAEVVLVYDPTRVTHVVIDCQLEEPDIVKQALRDRIRIVTIFWVNDVLAKGRMIPPHEILHLPSPFSGDITFSFLKSQIVSLTGFEGKERLKVQFLVRQLGASFTDYLEPSNTLLLCKRPEGKKYEMAQQWGIPCVNMRWLQDVYFGDLMALALDLPHKYLSFEPTDVDICLNRCTPRVQDLMIGWQTPIRLNNDAWTRLNKLTSEFAVEERERKRKLELDVVNQPKPKRAKCPLNPLTNNEVQMAMTCRTLADRLVTEAREKNELHLAFQYQMQYVLLTEEHCVSQLPSLLNLIANGPPPASMTMATSSPIAIVNEATQSQMVTSIPSSTMPSNVLLECQPMVCNPVTNVAPTLPHPAVTTVAMSDPTCMEVEPKQTVTPTVVVDVSEASNQPVVAAEGISVEAPMEVDVESTTSTVEIPVPPVTKTSDSPNGVSHAVEQKPAISSPVITTTPMDVSMRQEEPMDVSSTIKVEEPELTRGVIHEVTESTSVTTTDPIKLTDDTSVPVEQATEDVILVEVMTKEDSKPTLSEAGSQPVNLPQNPTTAVITTAPMESTIQTSPVELQTTTTPTLTSIKTSEESVTKLTPLAPQPTPDARPVRITFTAIDYEARLSLMELCMQLPNCQMVDTAEEATHLVCTHLLRTPKTYVAVAVGCYLVSPKWIQASVLRGAWLDETQWLLVDLEAETQLGISLAESIRRSRRRQMLGPEAGLFSGLEFWLSPATCHRDMCATLIRAAGGLVRHKRPTQKMALLPQPKQLIICHEDDSQVANYLMRIKSGNKAVHHEEFILSGVLRQELDYESYQIQYVTSLKAALVAAETVLVSSGSSPIASTTLATGMPMQNTYLGSTAHLPSRPPNAARRVGPVGDALASSLTTRPNHIHPVPQTIMHTPNLLPTTPDVTKTPHLSLSPETHATPIGRHGVVEPVSLSTTPSATTAVFHQTTTHPTSYAPSSITYPYAPRMTEVIVPATGLQHLLADTSVNAQLTTTAYNPATTYYPVHDPSVFTRIDSTPMCRLPTTEAPLPPNTTIMWPVSTGVSNTSGSNTYLVSTNSAAPRLPFDMMMMIAQSTGVSASTTTLVSETTVARSTLDSSIDVSRTTANRAGRPNTLLLTGPGTTPPHRPVTALTAMIVAAESTPNDLYTVIVSSMMSSSHSDSASFIPPKAGVNSYHRAASNSTPGTTTGGLNARVAAADAHAVATATAAATNALSSSGCNVTNSVKDSSTSASVGTVSSRPVNAQAGFTGDSKKPRLANVTSLNAVKSLITSQMNFQLPCPVTSTDLVDFASPLSYAVGTSVPEVVMVTSSCGEAIVSTDTQVTTFSHDDGFASRPLVETSVIGVIASDNGGYVETTSHGMKSPVQTVVTSVSTSPSVLSTDVTCEPMPIVSGAVETEYPVEDTVVVNPSPVSDHVVMLDESEESLSAAVAPPPRDETTDPVDVLVTAETTEPSAMHENVSDAQAAL